MNLISFFASDFYSDESIVLTVYKIHMPILATSSSIHFVLFLLWETKTYTEEYACIYDRHS